VTLNEAKRGESLRVAAMPAGIARTQILRLGIVEDSQITCVLNIPAGPVVVRQGTLEVALGRKIASGIEVVKE
jgi:Fe2+ transport system protein FeoA